MTRDRREARDQRQAVIDVVARFCDLLDRHDIDGLVDVFTEDCTADYGAARGGVVEGRAQVLERIGRGQSEFRRTHHQLGQSMVEVVGDHAVATTYVTATHEHWDGEISRVHLRYLDEFRPTPDGWRIVHRVGQACVVDGLPREGWNYVERRPPFGSLPV